VEIIEKVENGIVSLKINGRLDGMSAPEAEKKIEKILQGDENRLLFDLEALEYLSSAGLRVLLNAAKQLKRKGGKFVLCSLNEYVKEIFDVSGLGAIIPITDSVKAGKKELSQPM
jgi:anti-anti-sigma factor